MPTVKIEFDLDAEEHIYENRKELKMALMARDMQIALSEFRQYLGKRYRDDGIPEGEEQLISGIMSDFNSILEDNNVTIVIE